MRSLGNTIFDDDSFPGYVWMSLPEEDQNEFLVMRSHFFEHLKLDFIKILPKIYNFVFRNAEYYTERGISAGFFFCGPFFFVDFRQLKKFICLSKSEVEAKLKILGYEPIQTYETQILLRTVFPQLYGNEVMLSRWIIYSATDQTKTCFVSPFPSMETPVLNLSQINPSQPAKKKGPAPLRLKTYVEPPPPPPLSPLPSLLPVDTQDDDEIRLLNFDPFDNMNDTPFNNNLDMDTDTMNTLNTMDPYDMYPDDYRFDINTDILFQTESQQSSIKWGQFSKPSRWDSKRLSIVSDDPLEAVEEEDEEDY